jgi:hypothetical protein
MTERDDSTTHAATPAARAAHSTRGGFFGVVARRQSWLNLVYCALAFPLGLFYFVFLVVCLSVGIGLVIVWVGIFVLGLSAACWWAFASFERALADTLLGTSLRPAPRPWRTVDGTLPRLKAHFGSATTWKDLAFLFVKFPLGVLSFAAVVGLGAATFALLGAPLYYHSARWSAHGSVHVGLTFGAWTVDRLWQALLLVPPGIVLFFVSFHAVNGLAAMWRAVAGGLLERDTSPQAAAPPPAPAAPVGATTAGATWPGWQPSPYDWPPAPHRPSPYDWPPPAPPPATWPPPYPGQAAYPAQPGQPLFGEQAAAPDQASTPWPTPGWHGGQWVGPWPAWPTWPTAYGAPQGQPPSGDTPHEPATPPGPAPGDSPDPPDDRRDTSSPPSSEEDPS